MKRFFSTLISWIVGLTVFFCWIKLVGNPHVIETCMGLFFAIISALWVNNKITPWRR